MFDFTTAEMIAIIGIIIGVFSTAVYIRSILLGQTKPHLFTWIIWSILPTIGFFAQRHENAGAGSWALAMTSIGCITICILAIKYGEKVITRSDKMALALSSIAILPWAITKDPLGSVILISLIDLVGFFPTFRKSWSQPYNEKLFTFVVSSLPLALSLFSLSVINLTTALYSCTIVTANVAFVIFCMWRRQIVPHKIKT
ncbi:MAG: hypothetical protein AAB276_01045 [Pseudomonadota bacterium]